LRKARLKLSTVEVIRFALDAADVEFIPENGGGAGGEVEEERAEYSGCCADLVDSSQIISYLHPGVSYNTFKIPFYVSHNQETKD
jgi:hypothetical protein